MNIQPLNFITNLYYMVVGMLSIFIVIGVIVLLTVFLNNITKDK